MAACPSSVSLATSALRARGIILITRTKVEGCKEAKLWPMPYRLLLNPTFYPTGFFSTQSKAKQE